MESTGELEIEIEMMDSFASADLIILSYLLRVTLSAPTNLRSNQPGPNIPCNVSLLCLFFGKIFGLLWLKSCAIQKQATPVAKVYFHTLHPYHYVTEKKIGGYFAKRT